MMVALKTPVAEGVPSLNDGGTAGTGSRGAGGKRATFIAGAGNNPESGDEPYLMGRE
jgi:hypothetical protein